MAKDIKGNFIIDLEKKSRKEKAVDSKNFVNPM